MEKKIQDLTNEEKIERLTLWQNAGFVHPLTCSKNSKHPNLVPKIKDNKVVLECPKCKNIQENIPPSVLQVDPAIMSEEKDRLRALGFKLPS